MRTFSEILEESIFLNQFSDAESIEEIETMISEHDVIYYNVAMEFLMEHDSSLCKSLGLAVDMGYDAENLNSELLATILFQDLAMSELSELQEELEESLNLEESK